MHVGGAQRSMMIIEETACTYPHVHVRREGALDAEGAKTLTAVFFYFLFILLPVTSEQFQQNQKQL